MGWWSVDFTAVQRWQVTGLLAGGSILPELLWRLLPDLAYSLVEVLDIIAVGFIVAQSVAGSSTIGLAIAWLLIGYLTYQYTPFLYPDEFTDVVTPAGFRLLTALGTLFFGVIVWGSVLTGAVPIQVLTIRASGGGFGLLIISSLAGIFGGGVVFGLYFWRWHPEKLRHEESDLTTLMRQFFDVDNEINEDALPDRWQSVYHWQKIYAWVTFPALVCMLVGSVGVLLNLFYPIPEAALLVGLVGLRIRSDTSLTPRQSPAHEVDLRLLDSISGATRNKKGIFMLLGSLLGLLFSGMVFFGSIGAIVRGLSSSGGGETASSQVLVWLAGIFLVTFIVSYLLMGVYSLMHWVRQLERIEPYVREWERKRSEGEPGDPEDMFLPARPPGLLIPAHLPLVGVAVTLILFANEFLLIAVGVGAGLLTIAIVVMSWGLVRAWRGEPQSLTHESRDLAVTLVLLFTAWMLFFTVNWETLQMEANMIPAVVFMVIGVIILVYAYDFHDWKNRQEGIRKLLGEVPVLLLFLSIVWVVRFYFEGSTLLAEGLILAIPASLVITTTLEMYLEWIT